MKRLMNQNVSLATVVYNENPNYFSKVIEIDGKKIGYYVYNFFASGTNDQTGVYDLEMDNILRDSKQKELLTDIDLRFNSGGSEYLQIILQA